MEIVYDFSGETLDGGVTTFNLHQFSKQSSDTVLMYGSNSTSNIQLHNRYAHYKNKYFLDLWSPCTLYTINNGKNYHQLIDFFTKVYCICPYTTKWYNAIHNTDKIEYILNVVNPDLISKDYTKQYDICYFGGLHSPELVECVNIISKFNYRFMSQMQLPIDYQTGKVTNPRLSWQDKNDLVAKCKIGVCYNLLYLTPPQTQLFINFPQMSENPMYPGFLTTLDYPKPNIPQFKTRVHECIMGKTLVLCKKDPWNIIEDFYEPDKDFVYFNDNSELKQKIKDILNNWDHFKQITENAYKKLQNNYLLQHLIKKIT